MNECCEASIKSHPYLVSFHHYLRRSVWFRKPCRLPIQYGPPVAQYFLTTLLGTDTATGQETIQRNHQEHTSPCLTSWKSHLNTSLRRDDLAMQTQFIQFSKHLLNPCDVSRTPADAEDYIKRKKKKMTLSSRRSSSTGQEMPRNFKAKSPEMSALIADGRMPCEHRGSRN